MRFSFTLLLAVSAQVAFSQVMLKTNLLYPTLVRGAAVALEVATPKHSSVNLYAAFGSNGDLALADTYTFQNLIVEKRFYKNSASFFRGAYWAPYAKYMHRQIYKEGLHGSIITTRGRDSDGHSLGLGTVVGLQVPNRFIKRTFIDAFLGGGYLAYLYETDAKNPGQGRFGHVDLRVGLSLGYLF
ncbi:DUF3575 domain-containing protein [Spirosoma endophyticum]|nr:DUF3575 domain-containing protein [Spirosoma endophyticum]